MLSNQDKRYLNSVLSTKFINSNSEIEKSQITGIAVKLNIQLDVKFQPINVEQFYVDVRN